MGNGLQLQKTVAGDISRNPKEKAHMPGTAEVMLSKQRKRGGINKKTPKKITFTLKE